MIVNANVRIGSKVSLFGWYTLNNVNANTNGASSFPNNQYDLAQNYGPTAYDVRNRVFVGGTIALPRGFRLNPFLVASSGIPFNITLGQDYNGDSIFNDRPTFATPGQTGPNIVVTKWGTFNLTPQAGQTVIPPYYGTGPGRFSLNLRLSKTIGFGPETKSGGGMSGGPGRSRTRAEGRIWRSDGRADGAGQRDQSPLQPHVQRQRAKHLQRYQLRSAGREPEFADLRTAQRDCGRAIRIVVSTAQD